MILDRKRKILINLILITDERKRERGGAIYTPDSPLFKFPIFVRLVKGEENYTATNRRSIDVQVRVMLLEIAARRGSGGRRAETLTHAARLRKREFEG